MTFKIEPVIMSVSKPQSQQQQHSTPSPLLLDRWHKVEDNGSGVTYYWQSFSSSTGPISMNGLKTNTMTLNRAISNSNNNSHTNSNGHNNTLNGYSRSLQQHQNHNHHRASRLAPSTSSPLIWSVTNNNHMRPVGGVKKPRTQRFLQNLLCCFGAKPKETILPRSNGNVDHLIPGHYSPKPSEKLLLPPVRACDINKKCLIVDLDETLVHSSFKPVKNPDFIIPVEIDGVIHQVYVLKRPYVDEFLQRIGEIYECILFTASLAKYADPVADLLDRWGVFRSRLFREACVFHKGNYVKDLNRLGRDLKRVIIVDNSPASYAFHPENAIPVQSWFDDNNDTELLDIIPFMEKLSKVDNVYPLLRNLNDPVFKMVTSSSGVNGNNANTTGSGNNNNNNNNNVTMTMLKGPTVIDYQNNDRTVLTVR